MITIWELLDQGTIIAKDEELGLIVVWNENLTLNLFRVYNSEVRSDEYGVTGRWDAQAFRSIDTHVMTERHVKGKDQKITLAGAKRRAEKWLKDLVEEEEQ